ncbi:hypothetical protein GCM10029992_38470 [Glycomyces albus]
MAGERVDRQADDGEDRGPADALGPHVAAEEQRQRHEREGGQDERDADDQAEMGADADPREHEGGG